MARKLASRSVAFVYYNADMRGAYKRVVRGLASSYQADRETITLVEELAAQGVDVTFIGCATTENFVEQLSDRVRAVGLALDPHSEASEIASQVVRQQFDEVVVRLPFRFLMSQLIFAKTRVLPLLADSFCERGIRGFRSRLRLRSLIETLNAPAIEWVGNHCDAASLHLVDLGVKAEKIFAYDYKHPRAPAQLTPRSSRLTGGPSRLIYVGAVSEAKGVFDLIRAVGRLHRKGFRITLDVAGSGDLSTLAQLRAREGVEDIVKIHGLVSNDIAFSLMQTADVVVIPSHWSYSEGFPLTMLEALAARTPIVCSDHPMFTRHLRHGISALIFPERSIQGLADAIRRCCSDSVLYEQLSKEAEKTWTSLRGPANFSEVVKRWITNTIDDREWLRAQSLTSRNLIN